jgi:hypothetical protein
MIDNSVMVLRTPRLCRPVFVTAGIGAQSITLHAETSLALRIDVPSVEFCV